MSHEEKFNAEKIKDNLIKVGLSLQNLLNIFLIFKFHKTKTTYFITFNWSQSNRIVLSLVSNKSTHNSHSNQLDFTHRFLVASTTLSYIYLILGVLLSIFTKFIRWEK